MPAGVDEPPGPALRTLGFECDGRGLVVLVPTVVLAFYTIVKSKRLSDFLEALSDERLPTGAKFRVLMDVWKRKRA